MIEYMIEVNDDRMIIIHLDFPLYNVQVTINDELEEYILPDNYDHTDTIEFHHTELSFNNKFSLFKDMLKKVAGIDSIDFNRFEIGIFKGRMFKWESIIHDIMYLLLCFYDVSDGRAELVEFEIKKEAKIKRKKRKSFEDKFPKEYTLNYETKAEGTNF